MGNRGTVICPYTQADIHIISPISNLGSGPQSWRMWLCHAVSGRRETEWIAAQSQEAWHGVDRPVMHETTSRCHADDPALQAFQSCWWICISKTPSSLIVTSRSWFQWQKMREVQKVEASLSQGHCFASAGDFAFTVISTFSPQLLLLFHTASQHHSTDAACKTRAV